MTADSKTPPHDASSAETASPAPASKSTSRAPLVAVVIALALPGSTAALWLAPRPANPAEMPPLVIPAADAQAAIDHATRLAQAAPGDDDATETRRRELYLAFGLAEVRPATEPTEAHAREEELERLADDEAAHGTLDAARARDVERTVAALLSRGAGDERLGEIGRLPDLLTTYGAIVDGRRVAPPIVVHALAWARWNGVHRRTLTEGMDDTLLRAYHGWLVYYGPANGTELRNAALYEYVRVGGMRGLETEGFLRLSRHDATGARLAFEAAYEATGNVRLRNHALALGLAELEQDEPGPTGGS